MDPAEDEPICIVPYDQRWPKAFEIEKHLLAAVLAPWLAGPIEHIGSTAVPGLSAKPVIDIMAAIEDLPSSDEAISRLKDEAYLYFPYRSDVMHWFCKPNPMHRTHHLHLVPHKSRLWHERVGFRDALRSDPALARDYLALKHSLAAMHPSDREAYTEGKGPFISRAIARSPDRT